MSSSTIYKCDMCGITMEQVEKNSLDINYRAVWKTSYTFDICDSCKESVLLYCHVKIK